MSQNQRQGIPHSQGIPGPQSHPGQGHPGQRPANPSIPGQTQLNTPGHPHAPPHQVVTQPVPGRTIQYSASHQLVHNNPQSTPVSTSYHPQPRMSAPAHGYPANPAMHPFPNQMQGQPGRGLAIQNPSFGMNRPQTMPRQPHYPHHNPQPRVQQPPQHPAYPNPPFNHANQSYTRYTNPQQISSPPFIPGQQTGQQSFYSSRQMVPSPYNPSVYYTQATPANPHQQNQLQHQQQPPQQQLHPNPSPAGPGASATAGSNLGAPEFIPGMGPAAFPGMPQPPHLSRAEQAPKRVSRAIPITDPDTGKAVDITGKAAPTDDKRPKTPQLSGGEDRQPRSRQASESLREQPPKSSTPAAPSPAPQQISPQPEAAKPATVAAPPTEKRQQSPTELQETVSVQQDKPQKTNEETKQEDVQKAPAVVEVAAEKVKEDVTDDMDGWEAAPAKKGNKKVNKGGKKVLNQQKSSNGNDKKPQMPSATTTPAVAAKKSSVSEGSKSVNNSEPVKVEPVEVKTPPPVVEPVKAPEKSKMAPVEEPKAEQKVEEIVPDVQEVVEESKVLKPEVAEKEDVKVNEIVEQVAKLEIETPKENGISASTEPETEDSVFEAESKEDAVPNVVAEAVSSSNATPDIKTPEPATDEGATTPAPTETAEGEEASDPKAVNEFSSIASENRAKIEAGEKVAYGREFLLKFQSACLDKPKELPNLDVILDGPTDGHKKPPVHERSGRTDFMPSYVHNSKQGKRPSRTGKDRRPSANPQKTISLPSSRQVKLHTTDNAFKPGLNVSLPEEQKKTEQLKRDAKSILNKLTPEREETLKKRFVSELVPDSYARLEMLVETLFSKAIEEKTFSAMYAKLCRFCHETWTASSKYTFFFNEETKQYQTVTKREREQKVKIKSFREVLLTQAQKEFQKLKLLQSQDKNDFEKDSFEYRRLVAKEKLAAIPPKDSPEYNRISELEAKEEYEDLNNRIKIRSLGNTKFVGELYKQGMLSINIMNNCLIQLVRSDNENELESLCNLIRTIGSKMEKEQKGQEILPGMFQRIDKIIGTRRTQGKPDGNTVSPRIICLLEDVIDLKRRGWVDRAGTSVQGPKRIDDLHHEHQIKVNEQTKRTEQAFQHHKRERKEENQKRKGAIDSGEWVKPMNVNRPKFDPSKLTGGSGQSSQGDMPLSLGPRRRGPRGGKNASIDGKSTPDTTPNQSGRNTPVGETQGNAFALLDGLDTDRFQQQPRGGRTQSNRFDNRRQSDLSEMRPPQRGQNRQFTSHGKNQTHDGRMEKRKLTSEEVERKANTIYNDIQEADGDKKGGYAAVVKDVQSMELCDTFEHQQILIHNLIEKVIEKKNKDRIDMSVFFLRMADNIKNIDFLTIMKNYVNSQVEDDRITDCPKFWTYFGMVIAEMFHSPTVDPKLLKLVVEPAKELMQMTKAATSIILELHYTLRSKSKLHACFTESGLSIAECMRADDIDDDPRARLKSLGVPLDYLLDPFVEIKWGSAEAGLVELLHEHEFSNDEEEPNFTKEFDYVEKMVPEGPEGRGSVKFTRVIVTAVMTYAVGEKNNLITRSEGKDARETNLSDCEILLRKYLDGNYAQLDTLFILAEIFEKYDNNATLIKETFNELYEIRVIDIDAFMEWKNNKDAQKMENYAVILAATKSFYDALLEEKEMSKKEGEKNVENSSEAQS